MRHQFTDYLDEVIANKETVGKLKIIDKEGNIRIIQYKAHLKENDLSPYIHCQAKDITQSKYKHLSILLETFYTRIFQEDPTYLD